MTADKILELARTQIGVRELDGVVKYNVAYYGNAYKAPWCCTFIWWLFRQLHASELFFGGKKTAYCPALMEFHLGQRVTDYKAGDIIFFNFKGKRTAGHVGICESWDGKKITTIDGNTGLTSQDNGGRVMRRTRDKKYIVGAYRPMYDMYDSKEDIDLTADEVRAIVQDELNKAEKERASRAPSPWSRVAEAKSLGITDGTRPCSYATREEVVTMMLNAKD